MHLLTVLNDDTVIVVAKMPLGLNAPSGTASTSRISDSPNPELGPQGATANNS